MNSPGGLYALKLQFTKEKKGIDTIIYQLRRECEQHHARLSELQKEKDDLQKHLVSHKLSRIF